MIKPGATVMTDGFLAYNLALSRFNHTAKVIHNPKSAASKLPCYITHVDANGVLNQAEVGWEWMGTESGAPLYFAATIRSSDVAHQYVWLINWFTPGSTHHYRIRYYGQGSGEQLWDVYIDYSLVGRIGST